MLNLGTNSPINKIYLGATEINAAYLGSTQVYSGIFTPNSISNLYVWLDANQETYNNGNNVTTVTDRSGNNRNFTGSGVTFDAFEQNNTKSFNLSSIGILENTNKSLWKFMHSSPNSFYIVSKPGANQTNNNIAFIDSLAIFTSNVGVMYYNEDRLTANNNYRCVIGRGVGGGVFNATIYNVHNFAISSQLNYAVFSGRSIIEDATSPNQSITINSTSPSTVDRQQPPNTDNATENFTIGATATTVSSGGGRWFSPNYVSEVIIYNKYLSDTEHDEIVNYLETKYNI